MAFLKRMLLLGSVLLVGVNATPQKGNNEYLPPVNGYDYPKPAVPFISAPARPATEYRPPAQSTPYRPPTTSYPRPAPTQSAYIPPAPAPYRPPTQQAPVYRPPATQAPVYRPPATPAPVYRPPTTPAPVYRPPATQAPAYRPPQQTPYVPPVAPAYQPPQQPAYVAPVAPAYRPPQQTVQPTYKPQAPQQDIGHAGSHDHDHSAGHVHEAGMPYDFNYAVKDDYYGTDFSQNEVSDGDNVKGEYRVQLPDGRLQIVRYTADWKTGFHADVSYEGEARFPEVAPYKPPQRDFQQQPSNTASNQVNAGYNYPAPSQTPSTGY